MAYQYPYSKVLVADDTDFVLDDHHNAQEDQIFELTEAIKALDDAYPKGAQLTGHAGEYLKVNVGESAFEFTPSALGPHGSIHEDGGGDDIDVGGLSGELTDPQPPKTHASAHEPGGADEVHVTAGSVDIIKFSAHKDSPGTINKGEAVYLTGWHVAHATIHVEKARADVVGTMPGLGIAEDAITDADPPGDIVMSGRITGLDTSMWNEQDDLYISATTAGALTNVKPIGPCFIQKIAEVVRKDAANGIIIIFGAGRANAVPNIPQNKLWMGDANGVSQETALATIQTHAPQAHAASHEGGGDAITPSGIGADLAGTPRPPTAHKDTHKSGDSDPFGTSDLLEAIVKRIRETGGPTTLLVGAIPDGNVVVRAGSALVGGGFFGQNAQNAVDRTLSTTTAITPQQKLKMTTPSLPAGTYRIGWGWSWYFTSGANDFAAQVQVDDDGALILIEQQETPADTGTNQKNIVGGFAYITFGSPGAHDVDIDFYRIGGVGTAGIQDARLEIWRVA